MNFDSDKLQEKYHVIQRVAKGARSIVYSCIDRLDGSMLALKVESLSSDNARLRHEYKVYRVLSSHTFGYPSIHYYKETPNNRLMVMDLLGFNLEDLFLRCNKRFTLVTTIKITIQLITRLESLHDQNFIHRNIEPSNFCIGLDSNQDIIFFSNLGLVKLFRDISNGINHIPFASKKHKSKVSTLFSSINSMLGFETSRKDDLESLGYMIVYFLLGGLPWERAQNDKNLVLSKKQNISIERLADDQPKAIKTLLKYFKGLEFEAKPDYDYMRLLLIDLLSSLENSSAPFDWSNIVLNRDRIVPGKNGITLHPANKPLVHANLTTRPRTAFDRSSKVVVTGTGSNYRPSTACSIRSSVFLKQLHVSNNDNDTNNSKN